MSAWFYMHATNEPRIWNATCVLLGVAQTDIVFIEAKGLLKGDEVHLVVVAHRHRRDVEDGCGRADMVLVYLLQARFGRGRDDAVFCIHHDEVAEREEQRPRSAARRCLFELCCVFAS